MLECPVVKKGNSDGKMFLKFFVVVVLFSLPTAHFF